MRTNIVLDDKLVKQVMKINPNLKTKKDVVNFALREVVETHKDRSILDLFGADLIDAGYAAEAMARPVKFKPA